MLSWTRNRLWGWGFIAPSLACFLVFSLYPICRGIGLAFFEASPVDAVWVGLRNFKTLFTNHRFLKGMANTAKYVLAIVPLLCVFPLFLAIIAHDLSKKWHFFVNFAFYVPFLVAAPIAAMTWRWLFASHYGLLNQILGPRIQWLSEPGPAFWAVSIVVIVTNMGVKVILFMAAMSAISPELYDMAEVDGCGWWRQVRYVVLPSILSIIMVVFISTTIGVWQIWETIYMLTGGGPYYATASLGYQLFTTAFIHGEYGLSSAIGVVLLVIIGSLTIAQKKLLWRFV